MFRGAPEHSRNMRASRRTLWSSPVRDRSFSPDPTHSFGTRKQPKVQQDINIDEFGDMGSDEDELQGWSSNFVPPTAPSQPQYNLVPYGFLRDDDDLGQRDYDGLPLEDGSYNRSSDNESFHSSPVKSVPVSRHERSSVFSISPPWSQSPYSQNDSWNRKTWSPTDESTLKYGFGQSSNNTLSLRGMEVDKVQNFGGIQDNLEASKHSRGKQMTSHQFSGYGDDSNPFTSSQTPKSATYFVCDKFKSNSSLQNKTNASTSQISSRAEPSRVSLRSLANQAIPVQSRTLTPPSVPNAGPQIDLAQVAALQQALTSLTQLGSNSGLNLLDAQNLLLNVVKNATSDTLLGGGFGSQHPTSVGTVLNSASTSNTNVLGNIAKPGAMISQKMSIPDGSGATRYPAPDVSALVFDPSTGYRFDASTGLHYDANSGYFFNNELKVFLRWDKFTQTYLRAENPPAIPPFSYNSVTSHPSQIAQQLPSTSSITPPYSKSTQQLNTLSSGVFDKSHLQSAPTMISQDGRISTPSVSPMMTDFSKPPPSLPLVAYPDTKSLQIAKPPPSLPEQKKLPNSAEINLFNKLRKAKLAQTAQAKPDLKQWGTPDPLLEAQKKAVGNKLGDTSLNINDILQRSRQFVKQKTGGHISVGGSTEKLAPGQRSRSKSTERKNIPSQSIGKTSRFSNSVGVRHSPDGVSPKVHSQGNKHNSGGQQVLSPVRKGRRSTSRSRSPIKPRGRRSPSPKKMREKSKPRGRSPNRGPQNRANSSPEGRKRRPTSRGRSPMRKREKVSKSPGPENRKEHSKLSENDRRRQGQLSKSPDRRSKSQHSRSSGRSLSPVVKTLEGTKVHPSSTGRTIRPSRHEREAVRPKSSSRNPLNSNTRENTKNVKTSVPPTTVKNPLASKDTKEVTGSKASSNVRNKEKDKIDNMKLPTGRNSRSSNGPVGSTGVESSSTEDSNKQSRANHRLVSERTFSSDWERKKPVPISRGLPMKKSASESAGDKPKLDNTKDVVEEVVEIDEYDFLNETLDDGKDSPVVDEYEEVLEYQDLELNAEPSEIKSACDKNKVTNTQEKDSVKLQPEPHEPKTEHPPDDGTQSVNVSKETSDHSSGIINEGKAKQAEHAADARKKGQLEIQVAENGKQLGKSVVTSSIEGLLKTVDESEQLNATMASDTGAREKHLSGELGPLDSEDWDIVDSVDDHEDVNDNIKLPSSVVREDSPSPKLGNGESDNASTKTTCSEKLSSTDTTESGAVQSSTSINIKESQATEIVDSSPIKSDVAREDSTAINTKESQATEILDSSPIKSDVCEVSTAIDKKESLAIEIIDSSPIKTDIVCEVSSANAEKSKQVECAVASSKNNESDEGGTRGEDKIEENSGQKETVSVRSVSDIEKFLFQSSQAVEVKAEQIVDPPACQVDKTNCIFSRLGEKLPTDAAVAEAPVVTPVPAKPIQGTSKAPAALVQPEIVTEEGPDKMLDPMGRLFNDTIPTDCILVGPINFIEHRGDGFLNFTHNFMVKVLRLEKVKYQKVHVCHEDVTGAPYHFVLIKFFTVEDATNWFKKHNGVFKFLLKTFKSIPGHKKQKFNTGSKAFLHYTEGKWACTVCRKKNFPPRSLCFGCFQHKDPGGFSPVWILDKASNCVGTPQLKFFVTKEMVLMSAPPLSGFNIKNIEMIMDEKMGYPAGICVFEMYTIAEAVKLKKYLSNRDIETVHVALYKKPLVESEKSTSLPNVFQKGKNPEALSSNPNREVSFSKGHYPGPSKQARIPKGRVNTPGELRVSRDPSGSLYQNSMSSSGPSQNSSLTGWAQRIRLSSPEWSDLAEDLIRSRSSGYQARSHFSTHGSDEFEPCRNYRSRSPAYEASATPSQFRPKKPDGTGNWVYPPPDPQLFKFEPNSGLDYDPTTCLYYEPRSCCFYNDDTNQWLEYDLRSGRYILVR